MTDQAPQEYKLSELVTRFGGSLIGADQIITSIAPPHLANAKQITFLSDEKYLTDLQVSKASSVIITKAHQEQLQTLPFSFIISDNPYWYFSQVSNLFYGRSLPKQTFIATTATISHSANIGNNCSIAAGVVIGDNVTIGNNCRLLPNVVIGDNVTIGDNNLLFANVTIYNNVIIGNNCEIHSGAVIGSDGFGYAKDNHLHYAKIPQIGGVVIGNNVSIGANTTIDCGTFSPTIIADGVIIDNLVQIAHNVTIGTHTAIAACCGIAGSTAIGSYCTIAGASAITGHITIADHTVIGGFSAISKSITQPDLYSSSIPATKYKTHAKNVLYFRKLPEMYQQIKILAIKLQELVKINDDKHT